MATNRNKSGQFVKAYGAAKRKRRSGGTSMVHSPKVITRYRTRTVKATRRRGRSRKRDSGAGKIVPIIGTGVALGYLLSDKSPVPAVRRLAMKIPGATTFGPAAAVGAVCLGLDRFVYRHKYLKIAGLIGIGLAAVKLGEKGEEFQWLGDEDGDDDMIADVD